MLLRGIQASRVFSRTCVALKILGEGGSDRLFRSRIRPSAGLDCLDFSIESSAIGFGTLYLYSPWPGREAALPTANWLPINGGPGVKPPENF